LPRATEAGTSGDSVATETSTPERPQEPAVPTRPTDPRALTRAVDTQQEQARRLRDEREIERLEKLAGRGLSEQEREVALLRFEKNLDHIDQRTADIIERHRHLTQEKTLYQRVGNFLLNTIKTGAPAILMRSAIRLIPGVGFAAGTISGGLLGTVLGAKRGYEHEAKKHFESGAIHTEYEKLKRQNPSSALAFLQSVLEGYNDRSAVTGSEIVDSGQQGGYRYALARHLKEPKRQIEVFFSREQGYRGNLSGLLELATFYRSEARALYGNNENHRREADETVIGSFTSLANFGRGFRENYRNSIKGACQRAMYRGAGKGALIGAGVGAVSDLISWFADSIRASTAEQEYNVAHERSPEYVQETQFRDQPNDWLEEYKRHFFDTGHNRTTDFGNALSDSMRDSLGHGIQLDDHLENLKSAWMDKTGGSEGDFYNLITEYFRFAKPISGHGYFYEGQTLRFNYEAMQNILSRAFANVTEDQISSLDFTQYPDSFFDTIHNADKILSIEYPQRFAEEAVQAGAQAAAQEGATSAALHGAGIGLITSREVDKRIKAEGTPAGGGNRTGSSAGAGGGGTETTEQPQDEESTVQESTGKSTAEKPQKTRGEKNKEDSGNVHDWVELLRGGKFGKEAEQFLIDLGDKSWSNFGNDAKRDFVELFRTMKDAEDLFRKRVRLIIEKKTYRVSKIANIDSPAITLVNIQDKNEKLTIDTTQGLGQLQGAEIKVKTLKGGP